MGFARFSQEIYHNAPVICPLCGERKARRTCPALGRQICAVCCGTKRLTEIRCPSDCGYLVSARVHPPAVVVRQQQRDGEWFLRNIRDLSQQQARLFLLLAEFVAGYRPSDLQSLIDDDVSEAAGALAATYETAARGLIYEHRPASLPAERLASALKAVLAEAGGAAGGSAFERSAAIVLRRFEEAARSMREHEPANRRAFLDLVGRIVTPARETAAQEAADAPRLIVP